MDVRYLTIAMLLFAPGASYGQYWSSGIARPGMEMPPRRDSASPAPPTEGSEEVVAATNAIPVTLRNARQLALTNSKQIAVIRTQPDIQGTRIAENEGAFDPVFGIAVQGGEIDRQNRTLVDSFGVDSNESEEYLIEAINQDQFFLQKKNALGGLARIGFTPNFNDFDPVGPSIFVDPAWDSRLRFRYEQPLFKGAGRAVNLAPIAISRQATEQSVFQFQSLVNVLLRDAELAYWDLEFAIENVGLCEDYRNRMSQVLEAEKERIRLGQGSVPELSRAELSFGTAALTAVQCRSAQVIAELTLRRIVGLPIVEQTEFSCVDHAQQDATFDDLGTALQNSAARPEIGAVEAQLLAAQQDTLVKDNGLRHDLRMIVDYSVTGLEQSLGDSLQTLSKNQFNEWSIGVVYQRTLFQRPQTAAARRARLTQTQIAARLDQIKHVVENEVARAHQQVVALNEQVGLHRRTREAAMRDVVARRELYTRQGQRLGDLVDAEDRYFAAATNEKTAQTALQKALTALRFASASMLDQDIVYAEGH